VFALGTFTASRDDAFPGLVVGDRVIDLRLHFGAAATTGEMLVSWDATLEQLRDIAQSPIDASLRLDALRPLPPVQPIGQFFCAGANYRKHLDEITRTIAHEGRDAPQADGVLGTSVQESVQTHSDSGTPFVFTMPQSAVSGATDDVTLWGPGVQHDWELELGLVIGKRARNISRNEAMDCVAGFTMSNDISTRDVMFRPNFPLTDFLMTKGRPGFFPTGPYIVPREFVNDYRELRITLAVNDEVMQDEVVGAIIHDVEDLVSYASMLTDLRPGDILLTGSPGGNAGHHGNRWLRPGDVMRGEISGLGIMRNRCVAEPTD
jgi:2,4-diketo-3-deoxy-L-fuconate hydrolase